MREKKGFTILEAIVLLVIFSVLALFSIPVFFTPAEQKQDASVRANVSIAASAITSAFSLKAGKSPKKIAEIVAGELNKTTKNPIQKKGEAFSADSEPKKGMVIFVPDNEAKLIEINGFSRNITEPIETKIIYTPEGY